ncbi:MAG: class I SAM-dependent methyltransferase, partial [Myxococcota bacterium]
MVSDFMVSLTRRAKGLIKQALPASVFYQLNTGRKRLQWAPAQWAFARSAQTPIWRPAEELPVLQSQYAPPPAYSYDPEAVVKRGRHRARTIDKLMAHARRPVHDVLELGCWDGMVSASLQGMTRRTAIDLRKTGFDARASAAGVDLLEMDAAHLTFGDESFDFVFSYDTFEHFTDPEAVFHEASRVLRPGGLLYLVFGPLYLSPRGLHAYRTITVPYCHLLFAPEVLNQFADSL